jgi:hypothetical protein
MAKLLRNYKTNNFVIGNRIVGPGDELRVYIENEERYVEGAVALNDKNEYVLLVKDFYDEIYEIDLRKITDADVLNSQKKKRKSREIER